MDVLAQLLKEAYRRKSWNISQGPKGVRVQLDLDAHDWPELFNYVERIRS
jgi:hypothetical protein